MNQKERIEQLERLRVIKNDERFILEKFRIDGQIPLRSSACVFWRQILCSVAAGALFLCSFSPAFAAPFRLDLPRERLVPQKITPHLPQMGPFDQQISKDLNSGDDQGESVQEKSSTPQLKEKESTTSQHPGQQPSTQLDDPYQRSNDSFEQRQEEATSREDDQVLSEKKKGSSLPEQQQMDQQRHTQNGGKLPQTATSAGSLLLQGLAFILLGCALWKKTDVYGRSV